MVEFLVIIIVSQFAAQMTHHLSLRVSVGNIRASSFLTLLFVALTSFIQHPIIPTLQAIFLGSTFVGMTDPQRLSSKQISLASVLFCLIFQFFYTFLKDFGGVLGLSAFISCVTTHMTWSKIKKFGKN